MNHRPSTNFSFIYFLCYLINCVVCLFIAVINDYRELIGFYSLLAMNFLFCFYHQNTNLLMICVVQYWLDHWKRARFNFNSFYLHTPQTVRLCVVIRIYSVSFFYRKCILDTFQANISEDKFSFRIKKTRSFHNLELLEMWIHPFAKCILIAYLVFAITACNLKFSFACHSGHKNVPNVVI